ncbi:extracellular solute-binding protein [Candidatus Peregrinibacteria bacterium]|nr:extracellular solute-binding protein [Candidatus Peregrinibacteria bacterium]
MPPSKFSKYTALVLLFAMIFSLTACRTKQPPSPYVQPEKTALVYYRMNDGTDLKPFIDEYKAIKGNEMVNIQQVLFTDLQKYEDRIVNELAEGAGPDMFSMPNYWIAKHQKKIAPIPQNMMTAKQFSDTFVNVAEKDLVRPEDSTNPTSPLRIYGLPMSVDTLAIYYNKSQFEDRIPERGKPSVMWNSLVQDIIKLTKADNSFERFEVAGAALGRADNIVHAVDILYTLMMQYGVKFYDQNYKKCAIASQQGMTQDNKPWLPGIEALNLYTSFGIQTKPHYTWNQYLAETFTPEKEIIPFAKGKVSMIFGFSDYYKKITDAIKDLKSKEQTVIDPAFVRVGFMPQLIDPEKSPQQRTTLAIYYAETVSRTASQKNQVEAWKFLQYLTSKDTLKSYYEKTHKPTSRRDLIPEQKTNQIYGVFAEQAGFSDSILIYDNDYYSKAFADAVQSVLGGERTDIALKKIEDKINSILPEKGLVPPGPYLTNQAATQATGATSKTGTQTKNK